MSKLKKIKNYQILYIISIILLILFIIFLIYDYINYTTYSAPFIIYAIARMIEFFLPSLILYIIANVIHKKRNRKELLDMVFNDKTILPKKNKDDK